MDELQHNLGHQEFLTHLHKEGCEFGRVTRLEHDNLVNEEASDFKSVQAAQKVFLEKIFPEMRKTVDEAKTLSENADLQVAAALTAAKNAEGAVGDVKKIFLGLVLSVLLMIVGTVWGTLAKLGQDARNQEQTAGFLKGIEQNMQVMNQHNKDLEEYIRVLQNGPAGRRNNSMGGIQ